jgi:ubiquinone/menaquinone biosynthesis C-methylase UbiE
MDISKFVVSTYNKIADTYTNQYFNDLTDTPYIDKFINTIQFNAKILDIGCGPGTFSRYLKEKGFDVKGIDLSEEMLHIAENKLPDIKFKLMDMRQISYPDESFDGLFAAYSLIHIPSEEAHDTLEGFHRILKPAGKIMIIVQGGESDRIADEPLKKGEKIFINFFTKKKV